MYPPLGYPPVGSSAPGYAPPGYAPLQYGRPVYKPGVIPLRPLTLSDMFNAAVETIRRNPRATLGVAAVVLTGFLAIPTIATLIWGIVAGFGSTLSTSTATNSLSPQDVGLYVSTFGGSILTSLATVVLTGMIVNVVERAARGEKMSAGDAWRKTRPRIWRLLGLALLSATVPFLAWIPIALVIVLAAVASPVAGWVVGILGVLGGIALTAFLYTRLFQLAAASMVIEELNVFASMKRSWDLTRGQFWRVFGIALLALVVATIAGSILAVPFSFIGAIGSLIWPDTLAGVMVLLLSQNVAQVISGALTTPFSSAIAALLYLDQRIRKEGYDIEILAAGGFSIPTQSTQPPPPPYPYGSPVPGYPPG